MSGFASDLRRSLDRCKSEIRGLWLLQLLWGVFVVVLAFWTFPKVGMRMDTIEESISVLEEQQKDMQAAVPWGYAGKFTVTAYTLKDGHPWADGRGATLYPVGRGMVAADHKVFPPGTVLYIPGYGYGIVLDKGSAVKGPKLDVFVPCRKQAVSWGRKRLDIWVIGKVGVSKQMGRDVGERGGRR